MLFCNAWHAAYSKGSLENISCWTWNDGRCRLRSSSLNNNTAFWGVVAASAGIGVLLLLLLMIALALDRSHQHKALLAMSSHQHKALLAMSRGLQSRNVIFKGRLKMSCFSMFVSTVSKKTCAFAGTFWNSSQFTDPCKGANGKMMFLNTCFYN